MTDLVERHPEGEHIVRLVLNRPERFNALSRELVEALAGELAVLAVDEAVRCVILTGAGRAFAAGADVADMLERGLASYLDPRRLAAWDAIAAFPKPLIAAVNGYALGGGAELMMLCDIAIASTTARIGLPEVKVGVLPGDGGTQRLPRLVGKSNAMRLILTGEMVSAEEAVGLGWVSSACPPGQLLAEALALARLIAARPPRSVEAAKAAVQAAAELPLQQGLARERELVTAIFATEDRTEGMRAFLEKRPPDFKGH